MIEFTRTVDCQPADHSKAGTGFIDEDGFCCRCNQNDVAPSLTGAEREAYFAEVRRRNVANAHKAINMNVFERLAARHIQ